ncbi:hypothetical protein NDU88_004678 [Pleurodeles waltl]|uniref:Uncharacterized protein n=1 Tax=Pleurodeles waltl TaxID=8319 RepID=A0AAV7RI22_PLEWA|nr:hypothetical protein NDU88_004678 [Pleurodeles waltl]
MALPLNLTFIDDKLDIVLAVIGHSRAPLAAKINSITTEIMLPHFEDYELVDRITLKEQTLTDLQQKSRGLAFSLQSLQERVNVLEWRNNLYVVRLPEDKESRHAVTYMER